MLRAQDLAEPIQDLCSDLFGFLVVPCLAQGDGEVGLAGQGVRVIAAEGFP